MHVRMHASRFPVPVLPILFPCNQTMRRSATVIVLFTIALGGALPVRPYTLQYADTSGSNQIRWPTSTMTVAFSSSLNNPGGNIKPGSNVVGAARRALSRWSSVADIHFVETSSNAQSISSPDGGDGISLLTIADTPENNAVFAGGSNTGRTRIFFNPATGAISEADIVLNPHPAAPGGPALQFSTDGTPGTYDLESTFAHELGHLLGLEHSAVVAATMQARQGLNGLYDLPAVTSRTLSEDDRAAVRGMYGPHTALGSIEGKILNSSNGGPVTPIYGAHVWVESIASGRVIASNITLANGNYRIDSIPTGTYRVLAECLDGPVAASEIASAGGAYAGIGSQPAFRSVELSSQTAVAAGVPSALNLTVVPPQNSTPSLNPRLIGVNAELSTVAVPLEAGKKYTIYVAGEGVDQVPGSEISVTSPFIKVDPASLTQQEFAASVPVVSFDVTVAENAQFGDYSLRMQLNSGEVAYVVGAITIDPGVNSALPNPDDDPQFFVRQHYRDFLGRAADQAGMDYWVGQINQCGTDLNCIRSHRLGVSAAFFIEMEFQDTGSFVYRLYKSALGRSPDFHEFTEDRNQTVGGANLEARKQSLSLALVQRPEFVQRYPLSKNAAQFVDTLLATSDVDLSAQQATLIGMFDGTNAGRAAIVRLVADSPAFSQGKYNEAFVLMQYFGYLKRDPDQGGYAFWLNVLNSSRPNAPSGYRAMVCAFLNSTEYQLRSGMNLTHANAECGP